jgi:hypothetical protein
VPFEPDRYPPFVPDAVTIASTSLDVVIEITSVNMFPPVRERTHGDGTVLVTEILRAAGSCAVTSTVEAADTIPTHASIITSAIPNR